MSPKSSLKPRPAASVFDEVKVRPARDKVQPLDELAKVEGALVNLDTLKSANVIPTFAQAAKVVLSGEIKKAVSLKGIGATKGAKEAIEKAGGSVEALPEPPKPAKLAPKKQ